MGLYNRISLPENAGQGTFLEGRCRSCDLPLRNGVKVPEWTHEVSEEGVPTGRAESLPHAA